MLTRTITALVILHALLSNQERYKYIVQLAETDEYTNEQLTEKNISKAFKIADQFLGWKK